ncbi:MAG: phenylacetate--CoA ligase family protein, partial [Candidatus Contendobacter sp.]|nr:phenylacetate--CoA ligase family protein [Candidatus Contendobacter sp.]
LPMLKEIQGRATDFVVAADGTIMHGLALIYVVRDLPGVEAFKIVQESLEKTRVLLRTNERYAPDSDEKIRVGFRARLGQSVEIVIEHVAEMPPEASGKFRYVVSHAVNSSSRPIESPCMV